MTNRSSYHPVFSSIAQRLTAALLIFGVLATLVTTAVQVYFDYQKELDLMDERFVNARVSHGRSLSASVWNLSARQIEIELRGLLDITGFEYAEIRTLSGEVWTVGSRRLVDTVVDESPLSFVSFGEDQPLGTLVLVAGKDQMFERIKIQAMETLIYLALQRN